MTRSLILGLALFSACKSGPEVVDDQTPPSVPEQEFVVIAQSLTQVDISYTGVIEASHEPIRVEKAVWEFVVDGAVKRSGEAALNLSTKAGERVSFALTESLTYVKDEEELKAMDSRGGSLLLAMRGVLHITVGNKRLEVPFAKSREVRTPRLPHLKVLEFEAARFSESEMQAVFHLGVVNPNPFQISITGIDYAVQLSDKEVSKGTIGAGERVSSASSGVFDVTAMLSEDTHGKDATKIVKGLNISYALSASLRAALYKEELENHGQIKLKSSK